MDGQLSFAPLDYAGKKKRTKRDVFLAEIAAPVLIQDSAATRARSGPQSRGGRAIPGQGFISQTGFQPVLMARRLLPTDQIVANRF